MKKLICENCKNEVNDSDKFCVYCGFQFLNDFSIEKVSASVIVGACKNGKIVYLSEGGKTYYVFIPKERYAQWYGANNSKVGGSLPKSIGKYAVYFSGSESIQETPSTEEELEKQAEEALDYVGDKGSISYK